MQYVRWRPLHTSGFFTVTWVLVIYVATSVHIALCAAQSPAQEWHQDSQQPEMFSPLWAAELATEKPSCNATGLIFTWQHRGFGSNVNSESDCFMKGYVSEDGSFAGQYPPELQYNTAVY